MPFSLLFTLLSIFMHRRCSITRYIYQSQFAYCFPEILFQLDPNFCWQQFRNTIAHRSQKKLELFQLKLAQAFSKSYGHPAVQISAFRIIRILVGFSLLLGSQLINGFFIFTLRSLANYFVFSYRSIQGKMHFHFIVSLPTFQLFSFFIV